MELDTPCVGVCSTVYGDNVCRGCKRFYKEIINWNAYNDTEKNIIFNRLNDLIVQATQDKMIVVNPELLRQTLENFNIRYRKEQPALCLAYYLLRDARTKIICLAKVGVTPTPAYSNHTLAQLYHEIDTDLFARAQTEFNNSK